MKKSAVIIIGSIVVVAAVFVGILSWPVISHKVNLISKMEPTAQTDSYFEIKEFGLKFQIPDDLKDLVYVIKKYPNGYSDVFFSTKSLESYGGYCAMDSAHPESSTGILGVLAISQAPASGAMDVSYLIQNDHFYVSISGPQATCSDVTAVQDLQSQQVRSFEAALKTITRTTAQASCVTEGGSYGAPLTAADLCCSGLVEQPNSPSGTTGTCETPATAGLKTYDNFGIQFNYPEAWGAPQESINGTHVQISFSGIPDSYQFGVSTQANYTNQTGGAETFQQMMNTFSNGANIHSATTLSVNGITGKEIISNSAVTGQPYFYDGYFPIDNTSFIIFDGSSLPVDIFNMIVSSFKTDTSSTVQKDSANGFSIYNNQGVQFEYPTVFTTTFADLTTRVSVAKIDSSKLDSNGCYSGVINGSGNPSPASIVTIRGIKFCYSTGGDVGAGNLYTTYSYTTFNQGYGYTIDYVVHTSNGCGVYENSPDVNAPGNENYKNCIDFGANYDTIVLKPIQDSIATFMLTK